MSALEVKKSVRKKDLKLTPIELDPNWVEKHMEEMERERKKKEEAEKKRVRDEYLRKAKKAGFSPSQIKFLEENFAPIGHEHWNGRFG